MFAMGVGCRDAPEDWLQLACHQGTLRLREKRVGFAQGYLRLDGTAVGHFAFTASDGKLIGAANIVADRDIELWLHAVTSEDERERWRSFALIVTALHWFHHYGLFKTIAVVA